MLANPILELRDSNGTLLIANNDWQDNPAQAADITAAGLAPGKQSRVCHSRDVAAGPYTALLAGLNNGTGIGLVEVYDRGAVDRKLEIRNPKLETMTKGSREKIRNDSRLGHCPFGDSNLFRISGFGGLRFTAFRAAIPRPGRRQFGPRSLIRPSCRTKDEAGSKILTFLKNIWTLVRISR